MVVEKPLLSDLKFCIELYYNLNDHFFITVDKNESLKNLIELFYKRNFIRIIKKDSKIIAWILAIKNKQMHSKEILLQQVYYASSEKGFLAYKCVVLLHNEMLEEAKKLKVDLALSQGSHLDENNTFSRILEKNGWDRRGHTAIYRLPRQDSRFEHHATFFSR